MSFAHLALLIFVNACWGFNFIAGKIGTELFGPLLFSGFRFLVVLVLLIPFLRRVSGQMTQILKIGVVMGVGHYSIMFYAMSIAENISAIAIAAQLAVPISTLLAVVFLQERVGLTRSIAIALSFMGVVLIGFEPISGDHLLSVMLATLGSVAIAVASIWMRQLNAVGVFNLQAWIALIAAPSLLLLAYLIESPDPEHFADIRWQDYWSPVYSAIGATIIGHGSFYYLLQRYPVNQVSPFITLSTLFAILFGVTLMNDVLTPRIVMGGLLTLIGVTIIARRNAKKGTPTAQRVPR